MKKPRSVSLKSILTCLLASSIAACRGDNSGEDAPPEAVAPGPQRVELTADQMTSAGIAVAVIEERPLTDQFEATAEIEAAPNRFAQVGARVVGRVLTVAVAEGDKVAAGQPLAVIDSPELGQATGDYLAAVTTANVAREIADRERALFDRRISSEREWRLAEAEAVRTRAAKEAAENRLHAFGLSDAELQKLQVERHFSSEVSVRSPLSGVVSSRTAAIGRIVQPGDGLFEVVDLAEVAIAIDVYEQSLTRVKPGQQVEVRTVATGSALFRGHVSSVGAVIERQSRTVKVRVVLHNPDRILRPGMFATVRVLGSGPSSTAERVLVAPTTAVQQDGSAAIVFVRVGPRTFERREVELGPAQGDLTVVRRGLSPGDVVVTAGSFILKAELRKGELGEQE
ncbi:MAG: efflux RND transporter periplasmic adaptor subunit [Gemmatimonadetes bacterium]|nr:efflux RND transporter periplasmic adaptor subunit [Gemmatimonadota bacterium]